MKLIINPDDKVVKSITEAIHNNDGHCPCQIEKSEDTLCPCKDFYEGVCHCKLFIVKENQ